MGRREAGENRDLVMSSSLSEPSLRPSPVPEAPTCSTQAAFLLWKTIHILLIEAIAKIVVYSRSVHTDSSIPWFTVTNGEVKFLFWFFFL